MKEIRHFLCVRKSVKTLQGDDSMYASMVRPKLTTVHQDVRQKAHVALKRLMKLIQGESLKELNIKSPVYLVKRDSVRE